MNIENRELKAEIIRRYGTQFAFAHAIRWHEARVSKVVRGRVQLDEATKHRWAVLLDAPVNRLFPQNGAAVGELVKA